MANLVWANTNISGYVMHNSIGIVMRSTYALHIGLRVLAPQLASIHLPCNRHEMECFLLQESTDQKCP